MILNCYNFLRNWLFEPLHRFKKSDPSAQLWIPFFLLLSSVPLLWESKIENSYIRFLYNLLLIYFSSYLSNKIPYTITKIHSFKRLIQDKEQYSDAKKKEAFYKELTSFSCSEIRTLYAILFFIASLLILTSTNPFYENNTHYIWWLIVVIVVLLFAYRTIFYILASLSNEDQSAVEIFDEKIKSPQTLDNNPPTIYR